MVAKSRITLWPDTLKRLRVAAGFATLVSGLTMVMCIAQPSPPQLQLDYLAGSLTSDKPQAVYAADPNDSWNLIFYCLFTHTVQTRLSNDFKGGAPFNPVEVMGLPKLTASTRSFARIESGDRAIEPLYPLLSANTVSQAFKEPRFSQLESALTEALKENTRRSALHRALMQSDAWAAYDILSRNYYFEDQAGPAHYQRKHRLKQLLARFIKKLALTSQEINALPDNYTMAARKHRLPDLFATNGDWMEIEWQPEREHDRAAQFRRVARVFVKPSAPPLDTRRFLDSLRSERLNENKRLDSVALVVQNLLINTEGEIVPTRLTYDVQLRHFAKTEEGKTGMKVYELSRQLLLTNPESGGLRASEEHEPAYLSTAGNDLAFASGTPILAPLRSRCVSCHGDKLQVVLTLSQHSIEEMPPIRQLSPADNSHSRYVAKYKLQSGDFKELKKQWLSADD